MKTSRSAFAGYPRDEFTTLPETRDRLLATALKDLPVGTAYAVWTGIGAAGTAIVGMALLGESANPLRIGSIVLIVAGVVGLRLATA